jgi:hypothetical protein
MDPVIGYTIFVFHPCDLKFVEYRRREHHVSFFRRLRVC